MKEMTERQAEHWARNLTASELAERLYAMADEIDAAQRRAVLRQAAVRLYQLDRA